MPSNIRFLREKFQMPQKSMAQLIGKKKSVIGNYESGISLPPINSLIIYSKYFGVSLDDLVFTNLKQETEILRHALSIDENRLLRILIANTNTPELTEYMHYDTLDRKDLLLQVRKLESIVRDLSNKSTALNKVVLKLILGSKNTLTELEKIGNS